MPILRYSDNNNNQVAVGHEDLQLSQFVRDRLAARASYAQIVTEMISDYGVSIGYAHSIMDSVRQAMDSPLDGERFKVVVPGDSDGDAMGYVGQVGTVSLSSDGQIGLDMGDGNQLIYPDAATFALGTEKAGNKTTTASIGKRGRLGAAKRATRSVSGVFDDVGAVVDKLVQSVPVDIDKFEEILISYDIYLDGARWVADAVNAIPKADQLTLLDQLLDLEYANAPAVAAQLANPWWVVTSNGQDYVVAGDDQEAAVDAVTGDTAGSKFKDRLDYGVTARGPFKTALAACGASKRALIVVSRSK